MALCLFFTGGTYSDYHKPSDTAANLNYTNLERSAEVVLKTVEALANDTQTIPAGPRECNREELKSAETVLSEFCLNPEKAGFKVEDMPALLELKDRIGKALEREMNDRDVCERIFGSSQHAAASNDRRQERVPFGGPLSRARALLF